MGTMKFNGGNKRIENQEYSITETYVMNDPVIVTKPVFTVENEEQKIVKPQYKVEIKEELINVVKPNYKIVESSIEIEKPKYVIVEKEEIIEKSIRIESINPISKLMYGLIALEILHLIITLVK